MLKTATLLIPQRIVLWLANRLFSKQQSTPVKTWSLPVQPFWQLSADVKNCNITVESLSPVQNVEGDKMEVHLHSSSTDAIGDYEIVCSSELRKVNITNKIGKSGLIHVLLPVAFGRSAIKLEKPRKSKSFEYGRRLIHFQCRKWGNHIIQH
ncbi:uncharacterized protein LOC143458773 [Clavelina lepadiformis]|uniref:uncharacterized protein LOC143458773 n=1 Tax=Clavelina lepadiformis TaxID=159417 RepID=UPI0040421525